MLLLFDQPRVYSRPLSESALVTDSLNALFLVTKTETLATADTTARILAAGRTVAETLVVTDVLSKAQVLGRAEAETFLTADSMARSWATARGDIETIATTDSVTRGAHFLRTLTEALADTDSLVAIWQKSTYICFAANQRSEQYRPRSNVGKSAATYRPIAYATRKQP